MQEVNIFMSRNAAKYKRGVEGAPRHRESNIELYRNIMMLLIVAHHYVVNSGLAPEKAIYATPLSPTSLFLLAFGVWGKIGINCFIMIAKYKEIGTNIFLKLGV